MGLTIRFQSPRIIIDIIQYKVLDFDENGYYRQRIYIEEPDGSSKSYSGTDRTVRKREVG